MNQDLYNKQLEKKLSGITDNTERYNIVNDFMSNKEDVNKTNTRWGSNKVPYQKLDNVFPKFTPYSGPSTSAPFSYKPGNANYGIHTPDTKMDTMWNWAKGVYSSVTGNTEEKRLAAIGDNLTAGFHNIPEINSLTGDKVNIKGLRNLEAGDLDYWKKLQRVETSKGIRTRGANIDPFDSFGASNKAYNEMTGDSFINREQPKANFIGPQNPDDIRSSSTYNTGRTKEQFREEQARFNKPILEDVKTRDKITKKLSEQNTFKRFFDPHTQLEKGVLEGVRNNIDRREQVRLGGEPEYKKSFIPEHGASGIGLGFVNSMKASRTEHAVRAVALANPLGASSREILMNSIGLATKQQKMNLKMSNTFMGRVGAATIPLGAIAYPVYSMSQNESAGQIAQDWAGFGGLMVGLRSGVAAGAALTPEMSFARFAMQGVGGAIGGVTGLALGTAAAAGIRDIVSNESHIRKFAKGLSSKELIVKSQDTQQSLTSRQSALNKLAKSGLNDRRQLLGNESLALSGLM